MPTILAPSLASAPLSDFDALCAAVANWLHRSDLALIAPSFVTLAEDRMNRMLRVRQMESGLSGAVITDGMVGAPAGTVAIKSLWVEGSPNKPLRVAPFDMIKGSAGTCEASCYAWQGDYLHFDGTGTVSGVLYERIPALSAGNATNWLLSAHPSAYLHGALREACIYLRDEAGIAFHDIKFQEALNEIGAADMRDRYAGPLVVRAR